MQGGWMPSTQRPLLLLSLRKGELCCWGVFEQPWTQNNLYAKWASFGAMFSPAFTCFWTWSAFLTMGGRGTYTFSFAKNVSPHVRICVLRFCHLSGLFDFSPCNIIWALKPKLFRLPPPKKKQKGERERERERERDLFKATKFKRSQMKIASLAICFIGSSRALPVPAFIFSELHCLHTKRSCKRT